MVLNQTENFVLKKEQEFDVMDDIYRIECDEWFIDFTAENIATVVGMASVFAEKRRINAYGWSTSIGGSFVHKHDDNPVELTIEGKEMAEIIDLLRGAK